MKQRDAFYRDLGARIRSRRLELKITQVELAEAIGISRPSLTNIESGNQRLLVDQLFDISKKLTTSIQDIMPVGRYDAEPLGSDLSEMPNVANFVEHIFAKNVR